MPLSDALLQDIQDARAHSMPTLRATAPALEALLYTPFPCLDHGFVRVVDLSLIHISEPTRPY